MTPLQPSAALVEYPEVMIIDEIVKPSGILCRKTARKISRPTPGEIVKPAPIATPSKNVCTSIPINAEMPTTGFSDFVVMGFFTEMQMRSKGVLEHVHDEISEKHKDGRRFCQRYTFRKHFQEDGSQHEPGTQRDEIPQELMGPFVGRDDDSADHIGAEPRRQRTEETE